MAVRFGDDQIASVLNRRGYSTGKGKRDGIRPAWLQPGATIPLPVKSEPYLIRHELVWVKRLEYAVSVIVRSNDWWRPACWSVNK